MGDTTASTADPAGPGPAGETSWERIARWRDLRVKLDSAIASETPKAVSEAKAAGVTVPQLSEMWGVTAAWIYTVAPARPKKGSGQRGPDSQ